MKRFLLFISVLMLSGSVASADIPDPSQCQCTLDVTGRLLLIPDGFGPVDDADFMVTVRNAAGGAIAGVTVEVLIGGQLSGHIGLCSDATATGTTGASGVVSFNIAGGGCLKHVDGIVVIRASDITIRVYRHIMSPDYAYNDDNGIPWGWDLCVDPIDLSAFIGGYMGGAGPPSCHDYNNDGGTDPVDLGTFIDAYKGGANCCD